MVKNRYTGLSTDVKPMPSQINNMSDGSTFYCVDTSELYIFDGTEWYKQKKGGGGGGGTSDFDQLENRPKYNGAVMTGSTNIPTVPTNTNQLTNGAGFITKSVNDLTNYTNTTNMNNALSVKADKATTLAGYGITNAYTKTETDTLLNNKADKSTTYTKTEADTLLNNKADKSTTYTKTETDTLLDEKQAIGKYAKFGGTGATAVNLIGADYIYNVVTEIVYNEKDGYNATRLDARPGSITLFKKNATTEQFEQIDKYLPDADTGWQTLTGDYFDIRYRKKNGIVYVTWHYSGIKQALTAKKSVTNCTLPEGFRPTETIYITTIDSSSWNNGSLGIEANGAMRFAYEQAIAQGAGTMYGSLSYPV